MIEIKTKKVKDKGIILRLIKDKDSPDYNKFDFSGLFGNDVKAIYISGLDPDHTIFFRISNDPLNENSAYPVTYLTDGKAYSNRLLESIKNYNKSKKEFIVEPCNELNKAFKLDLLAIIPKPKQIVRVELT